MVPSAHSTMRIYVNDQRALRTKGAGRASDRKEETAMSRVSIWAQLEAKPGKEKEVEEFLKSAQPLAERERETISWYAIKLGPGKYGIFDTFADEGRNAHLNGEIAKALFAKAKDLLAKPPEISKPEVLAVKS
jgi:quinol monooxygenase YgiN